MPSSRSATRGDGRSGSTLRRAAAALGRWFKPIAAVGTLVGVAIALYGQRRAIEDFDWHVSLWALTGSILLFAVAPIVQGASFWLILRFLAVPARLDEALVVWMRSFLLRYAPTGALAFVLRVREGKRLGGATRSTILTASGYEQLGALASGAVACVLGFALARSWPPLVALAISIGAIGAAVAARPAFLGRFLQSFLAGRGVELPTLLRGRALALVVAVNALGWLATGAATWTLIAALTDEPVPALAWLVGVYAFAWMLGFLVPIFPGGLGMRDGTLAVSLAVPFGAGVATGLALALRLANTVGELVAIAGTEGAYRTWRLLRPRLPRVWLALRRPG
jgi:glycosyltransferase 2 family protein